MSVRRSVEILKNRLEIHDHFVSLYYRDRSTSVKNFFDIFIYHITHPLRTARDIIDACIFHYQRSYRGWADCDTWDADVYIARVISEMCAHIARYHTGTPVEFVDDEGIDDILYTSYLTDLSKAFAEYVSLMESYPDSSDMFEVNEKIRQSIDKMKHLFDHFHAIND